MRTILRLRKYFRPLWRSMTAGLFFMALNAVMSGFSLVLILPIIEKVFMRGEAPAETIHVSDGLRETWREMLAVLQGAGGLSERFSAAGRTVAEGLSEIQDKAPPLEVLSWLCVITLVAIFLKNLSDYGRKVAFTRVEQASVEALRNDLLGRILHFPMSTMNRISRGQFISRAVTDVELIKTLTINTGAVFVHNLLLVIVYLSISVWASYQLSLVSLVIVPVVGVLTGKLASKLRRHSARAQKRIAEVTTAIGETLGGIRIVKGFGTEDREHMRFSRITARYRSAVVRLLCLDHLAAPLSEFWGVAIGVGVLYYGGQLVLEGSLPAGRFFMFLFALVSMLHPLKQLAGVVARMQRGAVAAGRVFEVLDMPVEEDETSSRTLARIEHNLSFEHVSFLYEPDRPVLRDVSFVAPVGTTTALVGPSGAGKSTLADLIPRFYDPDSGRVAIDGVDLRDVRRKDLRALIGIVSQEPILFDDTVFNNVAYGVDDPVPGAVVEAARAANAHDFIDAMSDGYHTMIGERGVRLSGGQRQRLAIARAVLRNPAILILDEATSSLDAESEILVQEALERLLAGRTTFVIAHRLSTVMQADQIIVLDRGRIVQKGTHAELAGRPGLYQRLYTLQFRTDASPRLDAVEF